MKQVWCIRPLFVLLLAAALSGCTCAHTTEAERMYALGSSLTHLSASVESSVRYKNPPEGIGDAELLALSTRQAPELLAPFADYTVKVSRQGRHAVVLVCDREGRGGLLEDAGCSSEMDRNLWNESPRRPCEFTLKAADVCPAPPNTPAGQ